jgi:hypothetical protein
LYAHVAGCGKASIFRGYVVIRPLTFLGLRGELQALYAIIQQKYIEGIGAFAQGLYAFLGILMIIMVYHNSQYRRLVRGHNAQIVLQIEV